MDTFLSCSDMPVASKTSIPMATIWILCSSWLASRPSCRSATQPCSSVTCASTPRFCSSSADQKASSTSGRTSLLGVGVSVGRRAGHRDDLLRCDPSSFRRWTSRCRDSICDLRSWHSRATALAICSSTLARAISTLPRYFCSSCLNESVEVRESDLPAFSLSEWRRWPVTSFADLVAPRRGLEVSSSLRRRCLTSGPSLRLLASSAFGASHSTRPARSMESTLPARCSSPPWLDIWPRAAGCGLPPRGCPRTLP
mmetsp:Transcript_77889/g.217792  ORF Transcript_77889/g.217792 Transcript_77889/m.217792 type:complete len:255 (-) Transcript_77889:8-772(-)